MKQLAAHPSHVFLDITLRCNLKCGHCDIWKVEDNASQLTDDQLVGIVDQIADWHPDIRLVLTGGELLLAPGQLWHVVDACQRRGVYTTMNSNGTSLRAKEAERLVHSGVRCVVVSLDSHLAEIHDELRGIPGTFERAVAAVRELVAARDAAANGFTVLTSTIVGRHNLHAVEAMQDFFEGLGVDTCLYQAIQPVFAREPPQDWWRTDPLFPVDDGQVQRGVEKLREMSAAGRRLYQTPAQFDDMRAYLLSPHQLPPGLCASAEENMMIDLCGAVRLCFHMERLGLSPVGHVAEASLQQLWNSPEAMAARQKMNNCSLGCAAMLCHAR